MRAALLALALSLGVTATSHGQPRPLFQDQEPDIPTVRVPAVPDIVVRELHAPTADAAGAGSATDLSDGWGDTSPEMVMAALNRLPPEPLSRRARDLQVALLQLPTPESQPPGALLDLRLRQLIRLGQTAEARSLADEAGFSALRTPTLAPAAAGLALAEGNDHDACELARHGDGFTPGLGEINLFCAIRQGDLDTALVLFNALGETDSLRTQPFAALAAVALGFGTVQEVEWSAPAQPVDLALTEHLQIPVPDEALASASHAALRRVAQDPVSSPSLRAQARAWIATLEGRPTTVGPQADRLRAIGDPSERARAVVALWQSTEDPAARLDLLPQLAPLVAAIAPRVALAPEAPTLAAILVAAGEEGAALTWFDMLETQRQGGRDAADRTAVLMILAGLIDPSRMPASPAGLYDPVDAAWLAAGLAGQGIELSAPWQRIRHDPGPATAGAPALDLARGLVDLESQDPAVFARGLAALVEQDHAMDARAIASNMVVARLHA